MSPTSYQTAPPRALIITILLFAVKLAPGRGLMSCRLCKKTEGAGFPFQIEIFAFTKHTVGPSLAPDLYKTA